MFVFLQRYTTSLKTLSLAAGIGIVLALQLSLTTFVSTSDISEKSLSIVNRADESVAPLNSGGIGTATLYPEDLVEDKVVIASPVLPRRNIARVSLRKEPQRAKAARRQPQMTYVRKLETTVAAKARQKDKTPEVRPVEFSEFTESEMVASLKESSNKRSFVSMIKKPFSWVKALGSKIF